MRLKSAGFTLRPSSLVCILAASLILGVAGYNQQKPPKSSNKPKPQKLSSYVVLVSIDGLQPDYIINPDAYKLRIPNLRSMRVMGAYAQGVESVYPSLSYPAHATIATGMLPADHGILSDHLFDEASGTESREWHWFAREIKTDTIWEAARREGLITAAIGYPVTIGANINFNLPEFTEEDSLAGQPQFRHYINPPGLLDELFSAIKVDLSVTAHLAHTVPDAEAQDQAKLAAASHFIEKYRPHLLLLHLASFDMAQHKHGPLSREALGVLEHIDEGLKRLTDAAERSEFYRETTFFIISCYGSSRVEREFRPNVVLGKKGLLTADADGKVVSWRAAAQALGGSAAILIKDPQDEKSAKEAEEAFRQIYEKPDSPIWRIVSRREASQLGANPRAAFYLDAAPTYCMSSRTRGDTVSKSANRSAHGYLPQRSEMRASLIAVGQGIKPGRRVEYARLIDIAPTIARLLGLEIRSSRGRVISEVINQ